MDHLSFLTVDIPLGNKDILLKETYNLDSFSLRVNSINLFLVFLLSKNFFQCINQAN